MYKPKPKPKPKITLQELATLLCGGVPVKIVRCLSMSTLCSFMYPHELFDFDKEVLRAEVTGISQDHGTIKIYVDVLSEEERARRIMDTVVRVVSIISIVCSCVSIVVCLGLSLTEFEIKNLIPSANGADEKAAFREQEAYAAGGVGEALDALSGSNVELMQSIVHEMRIDEFANGVHFVSVLLWKFPKDFRGIYAQTA